VNGEKHEPGKYVEHCPALKSCGPSGQDNQNFLWPHSSYIPEENSMAFVFPET
jgi:hypothetical protein